MVETSGTSPAIAGKKISTREIADKKDKAMGMAMVKFIDGKIAERWNVAEA
jgi:hypothetical protein